MIPTRTQIQEKLDEIRADPTFSTIQEDLVKRMDEWLDSLDIPKTVVVAGEEVNPKERILDDLKSYDGF